MSGLVITRSDVLQSLQSEVPDSAEGRVKLELRLVAGFADMAFMVHIQTSGSEEPRRSGHPHVRQARKMQTCRHDKHPLQPASLDRSKGKLRQRDTKGASCVPKDRDVWLVHGCGLHACCFKPGQVFIFIRSYDTL